MSAGRGDKGIPDTEGARLAAELFPEHWALAVAMTGKRGARRRAGLRKRARYELRMRPLRAAGASCGSCKEFRRYPHGPGFCCDLQSDFHGYAMTTADKLCADWRGKSPGKR